MNSEDMSVEKIIGVIKAWTRESKDFRNDGWVQKHYKDKLDELRKYLISLDKDS